MIFKRFGENALKLSNSNPWTNVYGVARTVLAIGTLITLLFNDMNVLFREGAGIPTCPICVGSPQYGIFCLIENLDVAKWISIFILLSVISGFLPQITGILHWWVAFSLTNSAMVVDGGDQITAVLTLFLIPICITDNRINHWYPQKREPTGIFDRSKRLIALSTFFVIRVQVALLYFQAGVSKLKVEEWADGTAMYYWVNNPLIGHFGFLKPLLNGITSSPILLPILSWLTIAFEVLLFAGLFMNKKNRGLLLKSGVTFHLLILFVFGLVSFYFAMFGALLLFLRPYEEEFQFKRIKSIAHSLNQKFRGNPKKSEG